VVDNLLYANLVVYLLVTCSCNRAYDEVFLYILFPQKVLGEFFGPLGNTAVYFGHEKTEKNFTIGTFSQCFHYYSALAENAFMLLIFSLA